MRETDTPVAWQYRWTNPMGERVHPKATEWQMLDGMAPGQSVENKIEELLSYVSDNGVHQYEVRPLYAGPTLEARIPSRSDIQNFRERVELEVRRLAEGGL